MNANGKTYDYPEWDPERDAMPDGALLYLSDSRGVYIPRDFARDTFRDCVHNVTEDDWNILLEGPGHEWYWDAWSTVCDDAVVTEQETGQAYAVYQDGDCWLIPLIQRQETES